MVTRGASPALTSRPTYGQVRLAAWAALLAVIAAATVQSVLLPDDATQLEDLRELGPTVSIFAAFQGFLIPIQRVVVAISVDAPWLPRVAMATTLVLVGLFLASPRMAALGRWRYVLSIAFVAYPTTVTASLSNFQWILGAYLVAMLFATPPTSRRGRFGDAIGLLVAGVSGPLSVLLAPAYVVRGRDTAFRWAAVWVVIAAAIEIAVRFLSPRSTTMTYWEFVIPVLVYRLWPWVLILVVATPTLRPGVAARAWYAFLVIPVIGVVLATRQTWALFAEGDRYFYLSVLAAAIGGILGLLGLAEAVRSGRGLPGARLRRGVTRSSGT